MICKACNKLFSHLVKDYDQCDDCFLIENKHPLLVHDNEEALEWESLPLNKKDDCYRYLTLLKRYNRKPELVSIKHRKWMLENCTLPTHLIPNEILDKKDLWI